MFLGEMIIFLYLILNLFYHTFVRLAHCKWPCSMYLFIYNKKEAGELMTKQNQMDITIHEVVSTHAYFHYKPELSINTKHTHKCTITHTHTHSPTYTKIHISTHLSIKIEPHVRFSSSIIRNFAYKNLCLDVAR